MDTLEKRVRTLFGGCRRGDISQDQANTEFADIRKCYAKTLEEAEEKVALANQMSELVDRYLRRLGKYSFKNFIVHTLFYNSIEIFFSM